MTITHNINGQQGYKSLSEEFETMPELMGIIPALITPFNSRSQVYEEALRTLISFQIERGVHGLWIGGTYGSGPLMNEQQLKKLAEIVVSEVNKRVPVIIHVGSASTDTAIELAKHSQTIGADYVGSITPYYYAYDEEAVLEYFKRLVAATSLPLIVYNNPFRSGFMVTPEFLIKLANIGVAGIKDGSKSFDVFSEYCDNLCGRKDFNLIMGTDSLCLAALMMGGKACISATANTFPELNLELYNAIKRKNYERAKELQLKVSKVHKILHMAPPISAIHEVLKMRGIDVGFPKSPMRRLKDEELRRIRNELTVLSLIE